MGYIVIGCIVMLVISALAANKFEKIANAKGFAGYFWWCFWLGLIGWAMVIALPDRKMQFSNQPVATAPAAVTGFSSGPSDNLPDL